MINLKTLIILTASVSLIACGGSSSKSKSTPPTDSKIVDITAGNVSQAIIINGAQPANIEIPEDLEEVELTPVTRVPVSANSAFVLNLSVPPQADKQVAGYIIELPDGSQMFIREGENEENRQPLAMRTPVAIKESSQKSVELPTRAQPKRQILALNDARIGLTKVVISGWKSSDFNLEQNLENLSLRIIPLLVNKTVSNIAELSLAQIQAADGFDMSMVQTLVLAVEAVATSALQFTLTWTAKNDVDLYVLEPGYSEDDEYSEDYEYSGNKMIYYGRRYSPETLGWLDRDNTEEYGPENITYNYQLPEGNYEVVVNFYSNHDNSEETNYALVAAIGDQEPKVFEGTFAQSAANNGNLTDRTENGETDNGSHVVFKFTVDAAFNRQLPAPIATTQYNGVWKVAAVEQHDFDNYIRILNNEITMYNIDSTNDCFGDHTLQTDYLPSAFRVKDGKLQVSDAFINAYSYSENNNYSYTYRTMTQANESILSNCVADDEIDH